MTQLEAMALSYAIEAAAAASLAPAYARKALYCAAAAIVGTTLTHPILWAIYWDAQGAMGELTTPLLEGAVMAAETVAYRLMATPRWDEAALFSVLANAASWWIGELIYALT